MQEADGNIISVSLLPVRPNLLYNIFYIFRVSLISAKIRQILSHLHVIVIIHTILQFFTFYDSR